MNKNDPIIQEAQTTGGRHLPWKLIIALLLIGGFLTGLWLLPLKDYILRALQWTQTLGFWGPFIMVAFYITACVLLLPGGIITIGAGFLFGVILGTITVSIGSTLGACAAFLVGRTVARGWVAAKVSNYPRFAAIDKAVGEEGFKIVLLTRLSPVFPFNLQNYAYGLTKVQMWKYALASWIGMLPGTIVYVYIGSGLRSLTEVAAGKTGGNIAQKIFFWGGLAATIIVVAFITRLARRVMPAPETNTANITPKTRE